MAIDPFRACGIYRITNLHTGRSYIGMTVETFAYRWLEHRKGLNQGRHHNRPLQDDWNALGADAFEFGIVKAFRPSLGPGYDRPMREVEQAAFYNTTDPLYNLPRTIEPIRDDPCSLFHYLAPLVIES